MYQRISGEILAIFNPPPERIVQNVFLARIQKLVCMDKLKIEIRIRLKLMLGRMR
tara:strand:+ start:334 stop:498 length:165 start_codon:yes stop_codon:yes gene_type:complete